MLRQSRVRSWCVCAAGVIAASLWTGGAIGAESHEGDTGIPAAAQADEKPVGLYPLDTCVVSGMKLGAMGDPVVAMHEGREIRFCCNNCPETFKKAPGDYLPKLDAAIIKQQTPYYPVETCLVSGQKLGSMGEPVDTVHQNRLVRFCCDACPEAFAKEPAKFLEQLDKAVVEKQLAAYPLDVCPVSGEKLGSMGDPVDLVHANRLVRLCCEGCIADFKKDPARAMANIDEALKAKSAPGDAAAAPAAAEPASDGHAH